MTIIYRCRLVRKGSTPLAQKTCVIVEESIVSELKESLLCANGSKFPWY